MHVHRKYPVSSKCNLVTTFETNASVSASTTMNFDLSSIHKLWNRTFCKIAHNRAARVHESPSIPCTLCYALFGSSCLHHCLHHHQNQVFGCACCWVYWALKNEILQLLQNLDKTYWATLTHYFRNTLVSTEMMPQGWSFDNDLSWQPLWTVRL